MGHFSRFLPPGSLRTKQTNLLLYGAPYRSECMFRVRLTLTLTRRLPTTTWATSLASWPPARFAPSRPTNYYMEHPIYLNICVAWTAHNMFLCRLPTTTWATSLASCPPARCAPSRPTNYYMEHPIYLNICVAWTAHNMFLCRLPTTTWATSLASCPPARFAPSRPTRSPSTARPWRPPTSRTASRW